MRRKKNSPVINWPLPKTYITSKKKNMTTFLIILQKGVCIYIYILEGTVRVSRHVFRKKIIKTLVLIVNVRKTFGKIQKILFQFFNQIPNWRSEHVLHMYHYVHIQVPASLGGCQKPSNGTSIDFVSAETDSLCLSISFSIFQKITKTRRGSLKLYTF
jgi:hypothetical protein